MAEAENQGYPFLPESNWWTLREQFIKTIPNTVSVMYIKTLLGLGDKPAKQRLTHLEKIGFIDEKGKPTSRVNEWRNNEKYRDVCKAIIAESYPEEFIDLFSDQNVDRTRIENWFKDSTGIGEAGAQKYAQFYILLRDSSAEVATERLKSLSNKSGKGDGREKKAQSTSRKKPQPQSLTNQTQPSSSESIVQSSEPLNVPAPSKPSDTGSRDEPSWFSLHVDLQIHISPDATAAQIDQIFASMAKHIVSMKRDTKSEVS